MFLENHLINSILFLIQEYYCASFDLNFGNCIVAVDTFVVVIVPAVVGEVVVFEMEKDCCYSLVILRY